MTEILKKPLIIGASVSQGYLTTSPGKVLAQRYTAEENIRTIAFNGSPAVKTLAQVPTETFNDRTAVIAVDLFFWDSIQADPGASLKAMRRLFAEVRSRNIPLVIGDIPHLLPSLQPQAELLNREIRQYCAKFPNGFVLPLDQMAKDLLRTRYLDYQGQRYTLPQLLPDGLHVSALASAYLADEIGRLFT